MLHKAFEVKVVNSIRETQNGYVYMKHGTQYSIEMSNLRDLRCNAEIKLDGKSVGTWRIPAYGAIVIERPFDDVGIFTFYKQGSKEAKLVDVGIAKDSHGLIEITFTPEYRSVYQPVTYINPWVLPYEVPYHPWIGGVTNDVFGTSGTLGKSTHDSVSINYCSMNVGSSVLRGGGQHDAAEPPTEAAAGMTGLSGESKQKFVDADYMSLDVANKVTINLRLVAQRRRSKKEEPRPTKNTGPRPILLMKETPVPPAVK